MNFEKLVRMALNNKTRIKNKKRVYRCLKLQHEFLLYRKRKMKLGAIVFILHNHMFDEVLLWQEPRIKYINQDTSVADARSPEAINKKFAWEWNIQSYIALGVVFYIIFSKIYQFFKELYQDYLPTLAFRDDKLDYLLKCGFEDVYSFHSIGFLQDLSQGSFWMIEVLTNFAIHFNIIF